MKKFLLSTAASILIAAPAMAADMPVKAPPLAPVAAVFSWTGCYIGANVGGARLRSELTDTLIGSDWSRTSGGVIIAGGQVGCNYQFNSFVIGGEWDFDWVGDRDNDGPGRTIGGTTFRANVDSKLTSTLAARFGFATGQWLFYGKAGIGWIKVSDITITNVATGASLTATGSRTASGPMFGAGVEYAFNYNWSVKAEYDNIRLSDRSFTIVGGPFPALVGDTFRSERGIQEFKLGLNYRFGGSPVVARY